MSSINANVAVGRMNFTFTDEDGEVFSSFRLNPADINVANRCMEVSEQFRQREDRKITTVAEAAAYNALSLDKPLTDEADSSLFGDFIPDKRAAAVWRSFWNGLSTQWRVSKLAMRQSVGLLPAMTRLPAGQGGINPSANTFCN